MSWHLEHSQAIQEKFIERDGDKKKKKKNERKKGSSKCGEALRTGKPISKAFGVQCNIFVTYLLVLKFLRMKGWWEKVWLSPQRTEGGEKEICFSLQIPSITAWFL